MKKGIHPDARLVVFYDISSNYSFLTMSTIKTTDTCVYEGDEYPMFKGKEFPVFKIDTSSKSHPAYTSGVDNIKKTSKIELFLKKYSLKAK